MTITSGFTTHAMLESAAPKIPQTSSTRLVATASPAFASSKMSFAVSFSYFASPVSAEVFASFRFATRTIPVAEVYCSRQPYCPQLHASTSSSLTVIWPISPPAPPKPATTFPSTRMPPPTPVPSVTMMTSRHPFAPPCHISPSAATLASFPTFTFNPVRLPSSSSTLTMPQPRFTQRFTTPLLFTGPGTPTPMPCTSSLLIPSCTSLLSTALATSERMTAPPFSVFVLISHLSINLPSVSKKPILQVVPPISTPNAYFFIYDFPHFYSLIIMISFPPASVNYCGGRFSGAAPPSAPGWFSGSSTLG